MECSDEEIVLRFYFNFHQKILRICQTLYEGAKKCIFVESNIRIQNWYFLINSKKKPHTYG